MERERYRREQDFVCIDVRVKTARQLFDYRDPTPFRERDLDDGFVEYVVSSAEEMPGGTNIKIAIHVADVPDPDLDSGTIAQAVHSHFLYAAELARKRLTKLLKNGQASFLIGLIALFTCLILSGFSEHLPWENARPLFREGFIILGWVAMWRPIELILYDWWPVVGKIRLLQKLGESPVEIKYPT